MMNHQWEAPVRDFMTRGLVTLSPDSSLEEAQRTLERQEISAVPILDRQGALAGILSTKDLLRSARREIAVQAAEAAPVSPTNRVVSDLMHTPVITVDEGAPLTVAAWRMLEHRIHRLVVVHQGSPSGILSTGDMMRAIIEARTKTPLSQVMTKQLETIDASESIDEAIERLDDANVRGLVVLEGKWPVGVFTHSEALRARQLPAEMRKVPVERVMSYEILCLDVSVPVDRVAHYARQMRVRRILAVDHHHLRGIATGFDLLRVIVSSGSTAAVEPSASYRKSPGETRVRVLSEHARLRALIAEVEPLAKAAAAGEAGAIPPLRERAKALYHMLAAHIDEEDAHLAPLIGEIDAWGQVRLEQMRRDHESQRSLLDRCLQDLSQQAPGLVGSVKSICREILHDMKREEHDLLHPDLWREDGITVEFGG